MYSSISENNGIAALTEQDQKVYSVGISTAGLAEIRMAQGKPNRHIIATTIDPEGAKFARRRIEEAGLEDHIDVKMEDIAKPLPYSDGYFDFVYARLVLHYLPKNDLIRALNELYRVLKVSGRLFVVVRSLACSEAHDESAILDPDTGMITYVYNGKTLSRYFHTEESIQNYLTSSGFHIKHVRSFEEKLCVDFQRTQLTGKEYSLIEVLASK